MNDPQRVDFIDSIAHLLHYIGNSRLSHRLCLTQLVVQLPSRSDLQNDVDVSSIVKKAVHFDYVRMVQIVLDLQFSYELVNYILLDQQLLLNLLQSTNKARVSLPKSVNIYCIRDT